MTTSQRILKQFTYAVFFAVILTGIFALAAKRNYPAAVTPTPFVLSPVEVQFVQAFKAGENEYDILAKLRNPNTEYGVRVLPYTLTFYDSSDSPVSARDGNTYILPGQTKYVAEVPVRLLAPITRVSLEFGEVNWEKSDFRLPQNIAMPVTKQNIVFSPESGTYALATGTVANASSFDLNSVDLVAVVANSNNEIIAGNKTVLNTFLGGTEREFSFRWIEPFSSDAARVDVYVYTNVMDASNFIKAAGEPSPETTPEF